MIIYTCIDCMRVSSIWYDLQYSHIKQIFKNLSNIVLIYLNVWCSFLDRGICVLWLQWTNPQELQKSCGEKGKAWPLSKWERGQEGPTPAWTGFYCFSGYITLKMVLIYYAHVCCRWLPFTDNKGKDVANYFKEKDVTDQGEKWSNWLYSILGRFSSDFRKLKILSKHLLPQFRLREF